MPKQEIAAAKVKAAHEYIDARLSKGTFWECGTDLESDIDLYLPSSGNGNE
jgi:hypothetical protein